MTKFAVDFVENGNIKLKYEGSIDWLSNNIFTYLGTFTLK